MRHAQRTSLGTRRSLNLQSQRWLPRPRLINRAFLPRPRLPTNLGTQPSWNSQSPRCWVINRVFLPRPRLPTNLGTQPSWNSQSPRCRAFLPSPRLPTSSPFSSLRNLAISNLSQPQVYPRPRVQLLAPPHISIHSPLYQLRTQLPPLPRLSSPRVHLPFLSSPWVYVYCVHLLRRITDQLALYQRRNTKHWFSSQPRSSSTQKSGQRPDHHVQPSYWSWIQTPHVQGV
jgi:hypothetical protein